MSERSAYGCIQQAGKGRWRIRWWADLHDGKGYRRCSKTVRGSRKDARLYLSKMQTAHHEDKPGITVGDIFERWYWPEVTRTLAKNSILSYESTWRNIRERWENVLITDVRPLDIQEWLLTLSATQTSRAMNILRPLMDYAVRYEMISTNPFKVKYNTNKPTDKTHGIKTHDKGIYTLEECVALVGAAKDSPLLIAVILAAFGSCRVGEALAPTGRDVSAITATNGMRCAVVSIAAQVDRYGNISNLMKTDTSRRVVIIPAPLSRAVLERAKEAGAGLLTHDGTGEAFRQDTREKEWARVCERSGLPRHPLRNLRNSWRTYMRWSLGADLEHVEHLMGHVGKSISERHYVRPTTEQLTETVSIAFSKEEMKDVWDILGHF